MAILNYGTAADRSGKGRANQGRWVVSKKQGLLTGVTSAWHLLKDTMPTNNPSKKTIADYMRGDSTLQVHRMPRNIAGPKHAIAAVIPDAKPLSAVFVDTFSNAL